jgi:hypothetical protein
MTYGRSIRLSLVDDMPNGLMTAEIVNWTGHVLTGPRSKLSDIIQRPECGRSGVYFLVGPNPENELRPMVYIGETDDVAKRLKQHNRPEDQGGKDFWEKVCLVTSKDANLTKAHVKYLESRLIQAANEVGRCKLVNGTAEDYGNVPEADRADMAYFVDQIRVILPVFGFDFLRGRPPASSSEPHQSVTPEEPSPMFRMETKKYGIVAHAREHDGEFFVLADSLAARKWTGQSASYHALFDQLYQDGILVEDGNGHRYFTMDQPFSSPSAAAAVVNGRNTNGRTAWKVKSKGDTYADWQDKQLQIGA